ncbi:DGQHR domain-containing protein [Gloeothece verrucosa]|uniref:DGQHR domain protein n=1 Tax=Gloeothece verrucosa (strain PCC 7822) TaxID=497965 RepID=E0UN32_GLOV7|nr:DGQHR domain-containing protein [Gloeothece verrucosa]ADN18362.1 DGQHR domain protein [Gloeothece verrucosa PCC 7822]
MLNPITQKFDFLEGNAALVPPGLASALNIYVQPLMLERYNQGKIFLAIGAKHGGRLMLQINVHATEIPALVRWEEENKNSNSQKVPKKRPINKKRVEDIKNYIRERAQAGKKWILGTLTANVDPAAVEYQRIWEDFYMVFIPNCTRVGIIDGQHRTRAIVELVDSDPDLISQMSFPISLILEGDLKQ